MTDAESRHGLRDGSHREGGHRGGYQLCPDARGPAPGPSGLLRGSRGSGRRRGPGDGEGAAGDAPSRGRPARGSGAASPGPRGRRVRSRLPAHRSPRGRGLRHRHPDPLAVSPGPGAEPAGGNPGGQREALRPPLPRADSGHLRGPGDAEAARFSGEDGRRDDREAPRRQGRGGDLPRSPGRPESVLDSRAVDRFRDPLDHGPALPPSRSGGRQEDPPRRRASRSAPCSGCLPRTRLVRISTSGDGR